MHLVFLALAALVCAAPLEVSLESNVKSLNPLNGTYDVKVSITNTHSVPLVLLVWGTPLDQNDDVFRGDMFYITSENRRALYIGIAEKRFPTLSDFVTLRPGQTLETSLDLLKGYWFPTKGEYSVYLSTEILVHEGPVLLENVSLADLEIVGLSSDPLTVVLDNVVPAPSWTIPSPTSSLKLGGINKYTSCDTNQQNTCNTADANANTMITRVTNYLAAAACASRPAYVTWFGACDPTRYSTVQTNFRNIGARRNSGYGVHCAGPSCGANTYAYVYPSDNTFTVYLCSAYWSASVNTCVIDSKPGTLIHEISHFTPVAGTQDYAYGTTACRNLATSNPARAIANADSHEYMAESCP